MLQQSYGRYIRDDGDALLRGYVMRSQEQEKQVQMRRKPKPLPKPFGREC